MYNRYGVDISYFKKELNALKKSLPDRPGMQLALYLRRLADVAEYQGKARKRERKRCQAIVKRTINNTQ